MKSYVGGGLGIALLLLPAVAAAYEPSTTLAGLAEQAALHGRLHRLLQERFGRSLGLFDPVRLHLARLPEVEARSLRAQLIALSPAEGYAPEDLRARDKALRQPERQSALGWLGAGAALSGMPASAVRDHFLPALHRQEGEGAAQPTVGAVARGLSSVRELMTGTAFDGTGASLLERLRRDDNRLGLPGFVRAYEQAVLGEDAELREGALAQVLLATGGVLALVGQAADPAHVRNDAEAVFKDGAYQRFVAERYGRAAVPGPRPRAFQLSATAEPPALGDLINSLAERTRRRFYSPFTVPGTAAGVGLPVAGMPALPPSTTGPGETAVPPRWPQAASGYLGDKQVPHLVGWRRQGGGLKWTLDERCFADYAAALLPEAAGVVSAALEALWRGDLQLSVPAGGEAVLSYAGGAGALGRGQVTLVAEDGQGRRRVVGQGQASGAAPGAVLLKAPVPEGSRKVAALWRGADGRGDPLVLSVEAALDAK